MTTLYLRLAAVVAVMVALVVGWHELTSHYDAKGYARAREEARIASAAQEQRMRELQRAAETRYVVQAATRDRFIIQTVKEIHELAAPLADCRVPADLVRVLSDTARCAIGDPGASCGADGPVPKP